LKRKTEKRWLLLSMTDYMEGTLNPHAEEEMGNDELTIYDVECGILNGKILERQRDKDTAEWKYKVNGQTISGDEIEVIAKLSPTGKLVIITVYEP
jgi:hypothetical protein